MFFDVVDEYDAFVDDVLCRRCIDVVDVDVVDVDCCCCSRNRYKLSMSSFLGENSRRCTGLRASSCCSALSAAGVAGEVAKQEIVATMYES
jgi:hypothetical protein